MDFSCELLAEKFCQLIGKIKIYYPDYSYKSNAQDVKFKKKKKV